METAEWNQTFALPFRIRCTPVSLVLFKAQGVTSSTLITSVDCSCETLGRFWSGQPTTQKFSKTRCIDTSRGAICPVMTSVWILGTKWRQWRQRSQSVFWRLGCLRLTTPQVCFRANSDKQLLGCLRLTLNATRRQPDIVLHELHLVTSTVL